MDIPWFAVAEAQWKIILMLVLSTKDKDKFEPLF